MPFGGGLLAGAGAVSQIVGGIAGRAAGAGDMGEARNAANIAFAELNKIGLPPDEAKAIVYKQFQQKGLMTPELEQHINQQASQMGQITEDPKLKDAQMQALQILQQRGQTGLTPEDRSALNQIRQQVATDTEAKREQILQNFAARGQGGSGNELIAALQGSQAGANAESQQGDRLAAMASQNALQAIGQAGTLGGQIRGQEFGESAQKAQAQDVINQFNTANQIGQQARNVGAQNQAQAANLGTAQAVSNANTQQGNQELLRQNQAARQQWLDQMQRQQVVAGGRMAQSNYLQGQAGIESQQAAAPWQAIGAAATTAGTKMMSQPGGGGTPKTTNDYNNIWAASEGGEVPHYDEGGDVADPDKLQDAQDSMRKAFGYADGGRVTLADKIKNWMGSSDQTPYDKYAANSQPAQLPSDSEQAIKQASLRQAFGYADGGPINPDIHQNRMPVTDFRTGGHVPGQPNVPGDSPKNDTVPAMLSPGEYVVKRTAAKSPFGKKLIKLLEAHSDVMKHAPKDEE